MAEKGYQERTEKATPKKRQEAREKGNVPKSIELNSAIILLIGILVLRFYGPVILNKIAFIAKWILPRLSELEFTVDNINAYTISSIP